MTTLAPRNPSAAIPQSGRRPSTETSASSPPFHGRSAAEYADSFALDLPAIRENVILDVGAGPSSFAVDCARRGPEVVALDPLYGFPLETLATHVQLDYARVGVEAARRLRGARLDAREDLELDRREAAQRFLADYESGFLHNRYVGGALPRLPFLDRAFDLVLCGHLLFGPHSPFSGPSLVAACRELVRVSDGEARIFPFPSPASREAASLMAALASEGIENEHARATTRSGTATCLLILRRRHEPQSEFADAATR